MSQKRNHPFAKPLQRGREVIALPARRTKTCYVTRNSGHSMAIDSSVKGAERLLSHQKCGSKSLILHKI